MLDKQLCQYIKYSTNDFSININTISKRAKQAGHNGYCVGINVHVYWNYVPYKMYT